MVFWSHTFYSTSFHHHRPNSGCDPAARRTNHSGHRNSWTWPGSGPWVIRRLADRFPLSHPSSWKSRAGYRIYCALFRVWQQISKPLPNVLPVKWFLWEKRNSTCQSVDILFCQCFTPCEALSNVNPPPQIKANEERDLRGLHNMALCKFVKCFTAKMITSDVPREGFINGFW